jgi:hypothetical protein
MRAKKGDFARAVFLTITTSRPNINQYPNSNLMDKKHMNHSK